MNRNATKRVLSFLLLVAVLCFGVNAHAEAEGDGQSATIFKTVLLGVVDNNAKEWMSSEGSRALFSACAILDFGLQEDGSFDMW